MQTQHIMVKCEGIAPGQFLVNSRYHGCHRLHFLKFPDFYLTFPWANKFKMPDQVSASGLNLSSTYPARSKLFNKFSFFIKEKYRWDHNESKCFVQPSMVLNQPYSIISIFPDF